MKIAALILTVVGFLISGISSLGIFYAIHTALDGAKNSESAGIATVIWGFQTAYYLSFANLFGFAILGLGILFSAIALVTGRKQPN